MRFIPLLALAVACGISEEDVQEVVDKNKPENCPNSDKKYLYPDADGDGAGESELGVLACEREGFVALAGDCNDNDSAINPESSEVCNNLDDNCDGDIDENADDASEWFKDADGDRYIDAEVPSIFACSKPEGYISWSSSEEDGKNDCRDDDVLINPGTFEICDGGIDNNCNGVADNNDPTVEFQPPHYEDGDGDGYGDPTDPNPILSCDSVAGKVANSSDCNDSADFVNPGMVEVCNLFDDDCDDFIDDVDPDVDPLTQSAWYLDGDSDGFGQGAALDQCFAPSLDYVLDNTDCDDSDDTVNPLAQEVCDENVDNDCNSLADDADSGTLLASKTSWYADIDLDGQGDELAAANVLCEAPIGNVSNNTDCDDLNPLAYAGATEICDGVENDCDSATVVDLDSGFYNTSLDSSDLNSYETTIAGALTSASGGDVLEVCPGTYFGSHQITKSITMTGLGLPEEVVFDAQQLGSALYVDMNCDVNSPAGVCDVNLSNMTLTNGTGTYNVLALDNVGGALEAASSSNLSLVNMIIENSVSTFGGGLIGSLTGNTYMNGVVCQNNLASYSSGCAFIGNSGEIVNSTFLDNVSLDVGAALEVDSSTTLVTITDSLFSGQYSSIQGGAFMSNGGSGGTPEIIFTRVDFISNMASTSGGAIYNRGANVTIADCSFINNSSDYWGGAIYSESGNVTISSSLPGQSNFVGNSSPAGAAIYFGGTLDFSNVDFTANSTDDMEDVLGNIYGPLGLDASLSCDEASVPVCQ